MLNKSKIKALSIAAAAALTFAFAACQKSGEPSDATIKIAYPNWAEGIAMTHLATAIIEDKFGREVELTMADPGIIYASLADGTQDVLLDAWLPTTHASYMEQYGEQLDDLGVNFEGAKIGLVVPAYVEINSIDELPAHAAEFGKQIIGIGQGAGIMKKTNQALKDYNLEGFDLVPSSGPAMTTALGEAISDHNAIVVTGWEPHWKFARYDLKFLNDPKGVYGSEEVIKTISRKGFATDNPKVAAFLRKMKLDSQQLGSLMDLIRNADSDAAKEAAVRNWITDNRDLVQSWING